MNLDLFMTGVKIGLSVAMPVGPICLLCIRKSLSDTLAVGIALALGVATANMIYAILGIVSITALQSWLHHYAYFIELLGALVIIYLGISTLKNRVPSASAACTTESLIQTYVSIVAITLTSPMTIALFASIIAGTSITVDSYISTTQLAAGVFASTAAWFISLSALIIYFKSWFNQTHLKWVNIIAGLVILTFGLQRLYSIVVA
jgi:threonine/homoserine/homoserine lactone efflux protein